MDDNPLGNRTIAYRYAGYGEFARARPPLHHLAYRIGTGRPYPLEDARRYNLCDPYAID